VRQSPILFSRLGGCRGCLGRVAGGCRPRFGGSWAPPARQSRREGRRHTYVASGTGAPAARPPPKGMTAWCRCAVTKCQKWRLTCDFGALRHQAWGAVSQPCGPVTLPPDAAVQQQPQPVVAEVAEAVPDPLHLLDQQVHGLGGPVGTAACGMEGEDLGLPDPDGASRRDSSGTPIEADQRTGQICEPQQEVGAPLLADLQPPIAHQPGQRPLHHLPMAAQPLARLDATPGDPRADPPPAQRPPATRVVVALVAVQLGRALAGSARAPAGPLDRRDGVHHSLQQHGGMGVGRRQPDRQWHATTVDQQVVLGPGLAPVGRVRAGQLAPRLARTLTLSRLARDQSSWPSRPHHSPEGPRGREVR
jgi:hypothetical protein